MRRFADEFSSNQHWTAIGRSENGQPIGWSDCTLALFENVDDLLQRYVGEEMVQWNAKNAIFPEQSVSVNFI